MSTQDPRELEQPRVQEFGKGGRISGGPRPDLASGPRTGNSNVTLAITAVVVIALLVIIFIALTN